jgi:hypothetical protein
MKGKTKYSKTKKYNNYLKIVTKIANLASFVIDITIILSIIFIFGADSHSDSTMFRNLRRESPPPLLRSVGKYQKRP